MNSSAAYKKADVDHNTINNQKAIAELRKVTRELYDDLRKNQYEPNGSLLAYEKADVDHNTINNQKAIAELRKVNREL